MNQQSPTTEKIALFMELFRGREDACAKEWYNSKTGKSGFSVVCKNDFVWGVCDKKRYKYKCLECPHKLFLPPDSAAVFRHLSGKGDGGSDTLAIYPLTAENNCYFCTIAFEDKDDLAAFKEACEENGVSPAVERVGIHRFNTWFFFAKKIPAQLARRFATALITAAMNRRHEMPFSLYDKIFPNTDIAPKGYFDSPLVLPLQGRARKLGNSIFLDENYNPQPDQWKFLSEIQPLSIEKIQDIAGSAGELGQLISSDEEEIEPWSSRKTVLSAMDFENTVEVVRGNMLHVAKKGISQKGLNAIGRLAAFKNPEYAKAERMRLPTRDIPRVIHCAMETRRYLSLPRGCENALCKLLKSAHPPFVIEDKRNQGSPIKASFKGELRPEQIPAAKAMLKHETGVLAATTAFGKTVLAANLIAQRGVNALVLVHTTALLNQWKKALETFLDIEEKPPEEFDKRGRRKKVSTIGRLGGGKNELQGFVDIAVMQSLVSGGEVREAVKDYGLVIVDECHHVSAVSFEKVLREVNAKYVYGLTATPSRSDGLQAIIFMQCGKVRYRVNPREQAENAGFERLIIPRFTAFTTPPYIPEKELSITNLYSLLADDIQRNNAILRDVKYAIKKGRNPIILTKLTNHVEFLRGALESFCPNVVALTGKASAKEKREAMERLKSIPLGEQIVIVATGQFVGEGFDEPRLDTLFLASPIAWAGTLQQYAGRLHRVWEGKEKAIIFDYVDTKVRMLEKMFHKRMKGYAAMAYRAVMPGSPQKSENTIYSASDYYSVFAADIYSAKKEIVIIAPYLRQSALERTLKNLAPARINNVTVAVITRPAAMYKSEERESATAMLEHLRQCGIHVSERKNVHLNAAIFDRKTVWYGSVNFLGFSTAEASAMRFENGEVACELLKE
ncbi:MAG: DEAD/DEAH box helicase family protein [Oscillospiraceae bacterium]|nr:DEAD/DEAH box helicase family protein [Oscillospiraceae bacterium]